MTQKWDVIIIGGGLAGYVAAGYLANTNFSVLLLEKAKLVGGRARTNKIKQQYFNLGPHALYKKGEAMTIFEELGLELSGKTPKLSGGLLVETNTEYAAPFSPYEVFTTQFLNGKEKIEWLTILLKILRTKPESLINQTFQQWVQSITKSQKLVSLLYVLSRLATYSHAPERVSAEVIVSQLKLALGGTVYIDGGWQTIIDQLHNKAVSTGVQIRTQTRVISVTPSQNNHFKVILANHEEIIARYVISTTSPNELHKMLADHFQKEVNNFLTETNPIRGATLDVSLSELPNPQRLFAMGISNPLYYSVHSQYARLSDEPNHVVLHVLKYLHPDEQHDKASIRNELEQLLDRIQPGWRQYVISNRFIPKLIVNQRLPKVGDELDLKRSKSSIPGLYIAGDWASTSYILADGAASSGKQAAQKIILNEMRETSANFK